MNETMSESGTLSFFSRGESLRDWRISAVGLTTSTNFVIIALGVLSSVVTARFLGPAGRGEIAAAVIWPATIGNLGGLGVSEALIYFSGRKTPIHSLLSSALLIGSIQLTVFGLIGYFSIPRLLASQGPEVIGLSLTYLIFLLYSFLGNYAVGIIQGSMRFRLWNAFRLMSPVIYLGSIAVLWASDSVTTGRVLVAMLIGPMTTTILAYGVLLLGDRRPLSVDRSAVGRTMNYGLSAALSSLPGFLQDNLAQLLMATMLPTTELGLYAISTVAVTPINPLLSAFQTVIFPQTAAEDDPVRARAQLTGYLRHGFWLGAGMLVLLEGLLPVLINLMYGAEFARSVAPAQLLLCAVFLTGVIQMMSAGFRGLGLPRLAARGSFSGLVVSAALLPTALPRWGIMGAASVSLVSAVVTFLHFLYLSRTSAGLSGRRILTPPFMGGGRE